MGFWSRARVQGFTLLALLDTETTSLQTEGGRQKKEAEKQLDNQGVDLVDRSVLHLIFTPAVKR